MSTIEIRPLSNIDTKELKFNLVVKGIGNLDSVGQYDAVKFLSVIHSVKSRQNNLPVQKLMLRAQNVVRYIRDKHELCILMNK